jgi:hypothetical protein
LGLFDTCRNATILSLSDQ